MAVEYKRTSFFAGRSSDALEQGSIRLWIQYNLKKDGIEAQLEKLRELLAIVGEKALIAGAVDVDDVARAIRCDGYDHRILRGKD